MHLLARLQRLSIQVAKLVAGSWIGGAGSKAHRFGSLARVCARAREIFFFFLFSGKSLLENISSRKHMTTPQAAALMVLNLSLPSCPLNRFRTISIL